MLNLKKSLKKIRSLLIIIICCCLFVCSCKQAVSNSEPFESGSKTIIDTPLVQKDTVLNIDAELIDSFPEGFIDLINLDSNIIVDIKYATENNFTKEKLYPCARCILLEEVANRLIQVNKQLLEKSLRLKVLDCYRPQSIQKKLWEVKPDPKFVMSPSKGSGHGRGTAVDVTLVNTDGSDLDLGSGYDEFTDKAIYQNSNVTQSQMRLRWILKKAMRDQGFNPIRTEWWHFQYGRRNNKPLQDFKWTCK